MKSLFKTGFVVALMLVAAVAGYGQDRPADLAKAADMIAGGGNVLGAMDVGDIYIWRDCDFIYVEYDIFDGTPLDITDNWFITATHVEIATTLGGIPQARGNPIPGQFTYKTEHDAVSGYTYQIPVNGFGSGDVFIAAHADVCQVGGVQAVESSLPIDPFKLSVTYYVPDKTAYFPTVVIENDTWLDGTHANGWCVDLTNHIVPGTIYDATAYSSYDPDLPEGLVDNPENLGALNWLMNQVLLGSIIGQTAYDYSTDPATPFGDYTWMDVQTAIWRLMDDGTPDYLAGVDPIRVQLLIDMALAHSDYVPGCGEFMVILLAPTSAVQNQTLIITVPVPCGGGCETAWGATWNGVSWQIPFPGKNWATYLLMTIPNYCGGVI